MAKYRALTLWYSFQDEVSHTLQNRPGACLSAISIAGLGSLGHEAYIPWSLLSVAAQFCPKCSAIFSSSTSSFCQGHAAPREVPARSHGEISKRYKFKLEPSFPAPARADRLRPRAGEPPYWALLGQPEANGFT